MNKKMLKFLVQLADYKEGTVDTSKFLERYPNNESTWYDVATLKSMGFVDALTADCHIVIIGVSERGIDYVKKWLKK